MAHPNGQNDRVGKLKEIIANTEQNMEQAEEILQTQALSEQQREQLEFTNSHRQASLREFKEELDEEFKH
ncbi:hypothetical protein [Sulfoacidibacillus thermotolerans]|uniref:Small, acid-soluble spore protein Tlp n=1 Tax=Sulfoacidibacillus thermotolerans TaxID=1765684 RepID=A0A2U3DA96_SULT2|nr:hypothetical protein [Sulfoacidibacillus thermotolerans]PWI58182.1 hypothetical protein BM613_04415 [Sulfoacidibacillus thermotolerans]